MDTESAFETPEEAVDKLVLPTDLRPDFCAEALSVGSRMGLLVATLLMTGWLVGIFVSAILWPDGLLQKGSFAAVEITGAMLVMTFLLFIVFGALASNNPRLTRLERGMWYAGFGLAPPIAFPAYWFVHIWPVPFQPTSVQRL